MLNQMDRLKVTPVNGAPPPTGPAAAEGEPPLTALRPPRAWQLLNVRELWQFRELMGFFVWRDVKVRYKQTLLGAAWAVLQPAMMMVVFTIFFGRMGGMQSGGLPYPVFVLAGLLPWMLFANAVTNAGNSIIGSERLITKVYFPRLTIPFAAVGAAVVDSVIAFALLVLLMAYYGIVPGPGLLLVPVFFAVVALAALGVGALLAGLNVSYRDFRYVIPFLMQVWMFATPTVYMQPGAETAPGLLRSLLALNPLTPLVAAFRSAALGTPIAWGEVLVATAVVVLLFVVGCLYFRKVEDNLADII